MTKENVINVKKLLHQYCKCRISPSASKEISSRIVDKLYDIAPELDKIAHHHGRKTIIDDDVIELFGFVHQDVIKQCKE